MSTQVHRDCDFVSALANFEHCLETPLVPGEMAQWLEAASDACQQAAAWFQCEVARGHDELLQDIENQDMELAPRVEELKANQQSLQTHWTSLDASLEALCKACQNSDPQEGTLDGAIQRFTERALKLVIQTRKHEAALTTWYIEAFNRDRGEVD
jgi:septal ring factor EnvC (AmiA/AmiB activator)